MSEMADGVEVLLRESCVTAAKPLLRGLLEGNTGHRWMLARDTERRALAYVVADMRKGLAYFRRMDEATHSGKALRTELDASGENIGALPVEHVRAKAAAIEDVLAQAPYRELNETFTKATGSSTKVRTWYEGADGPRDFRSLCKAETVDRLSDYEIMFRTWSSTGHGQDIDRIVSAGEEPREVSISVLRSPEGLALV